MTGLAQHLLVAPVLLPLAAAIAMLLLGQGRRIAKAVLNVVATLAGLALAVTLAKQAAASGEGQVATYLAANWPAPFGIVLVLDRLSAAMLLLTAVLALAAVLYSLARWHRAGLHFHPLFQFQLMGLNGAFLTGDLFNLFVFFEVMLVASYGLVLHGSGRARVTAGLHYIIVNLAASLLFLLGVGLVYGACGTLNMADLSQRIPDLAGTDRALLEAGAGLLGIAFLTKAGLWPLSFWLPGTYTAAAAPVAALSGVLTKVGVYVVLRTWLLLFGAGAGASAGFGAEALLWGGLATLAVGSIGALASQDLGRLVASCVLVSSGTVLAVAATADAGVIGGALFYLACSTLALGALFLLRELVERARGPGADVLAVTREAFGDPEEDSMEDEIGIAIPGAMALLGLGFLAAALVVAGLPPLAGFLGKFAVFDALMAAAPLAAAPLRSGVLVAALLASSLALLVALARAGIHAFWLPAGTPPRVRVIEILPVALLLAACVLLTVRAGPALDYLRAAATDLAHPAAQAQAVLSAQPATRAGQGAP